MAVEFLFMLLLSIVFSVTICYVSLCINTTLKFITCHDKEDIADFLNPKCESVTTSSMFRPLFCSSSIPTLNTAFYMAVEFLFMFLLSIVFSVTICLVSLCIIEAGQGTMTWTVIPSITCRDYSYTCSQIDIADYLIPKYASVMTSSMFRPLFNS